VARELEPGEWRENPLAKRIKNPAENGRHLKRGAANTQRWGVKREWEQFSRGAG